MLNPAANLSETRTDRPRRKLAARALTTANMNVWECPINRSARVDAVLVCNIATAQVNFRLWHVTPTEVAQQATALFYDLVLRPNSTTVLEVPIYMNSGDRLVGYASASSSLGISVFGEDA